MANVDRRPLKLFLRYDGRGRLIAGSGVWRRKMPKVGKWVEVQGYECCTTPNITCVEYSVSLAARTEGTYSYTNCDGLEIGPVGISGPTEVFFCAERNTVSTTGDALVADLGLCSESTTTTTTTEGSSVSGTPSRSISPSVSSSVSPSTSISPSASSSISKSISSSVSSSISESVSSSVSASESSSTSPSVSSSVSSSISPSPSGG
jgi:hypothetical protein